MVENQIDFRLDKNHMKRNKRIKGWYWSCGWEHSYFGRYHPDAEWCEARGRKPFKTREEAQAAGEKHMATHGHDDGRHCYNVNVWKE